MFSMEMPGMDDVKDALARLEKSLAVEVLADAVEYAAEPVLARAQELAPSDTGFLKASGLVIAVARSKRGAPNAIAKVRAIRAAAHAILQEFGVKPHRVGKKAHPGHKAQPFLKPAFLARRDEALLRVRERVRLAVLSAAGGMK
jgi:hypothetical protein